jgi:tetratricopeptide (TPR) repeat protein
VPSERKQHLDHGAAIDALRNNLNRVQSSSDPTAALAPELTSLAATVINTAASHTDGDLAARHVLGWWHWLRYLALPAGQNQTDYQLAVSLLEPIAAATPTAVPSELRILSELTNRAVALATTYMNSRDLETLDQAVAYFRQIVDACPVGHPNRSSALSNLGNILRTRFENTGQVSALDEAIDKAREAELATVEGLPSHSLILANLGSALKRKFELTGDLVILEEAIRVHLRSVATAHDSDPNRGNYLSNLGSALHKLYERSGQPAVLDEAIHAHRRAVDVASDNHPNRVGYLTNLGNALRSQFEFTADVAVLSEAIDVAREAVAGAPDNHPDLATLMSNLSGALQRLYEQGGELAILDEAIDAGRQAIAAAPQNYPDRPRWLSNLGSALYKHFERSETPSVLAESIQFLRQAVAATPANHPNRSGYLSNLSGVLNRRFERTGDTAVLAEAIDVAREAVTANTGNDPHRGDYLSNLGTVLLTWFEHTGDIAVLSESIRAKKHAVAVAPDSHPNRVSYMLNLGNTMRSQFEQTGDLTVLNEARQWFANAAHEMSGAVDVRILAARRAVDADLRANDVNHALEMAELAVRLLGLVAPRRLRRSDRQHRITSVAGLASTVATAALEAGRSDRAVELLEQARGLLIADTLDIRGDFGLLQQYAPDLVTEFAGLRDAIDELDHSGIPARGATRTVEDYQQQMEKRERIVDDWEQLLGRIRSIPSLSGFLLPPPIQQLRHAAAHGPIVYIVIHAHASHAIILTNHPTQPTHPIPLPGLTQLSASDHTNLLRRAHHTATDRDSPAREQIAAQAQILKVLEWLWEVVTQPVLDHLGYNATPLEGHPWPRIYWCPADVATFLPLHAAGHHHTRDSTSTSRTGPAASTVMDRVISSYIPTTRALLHTLTRRPSGSANRALIVAVPDAPGVNHLPGVAVEASRLSELMPAATTLPPFGQAATHEAVLAALPDHAIAHFACHGLADWTDPTTSRLILHDHQTWPFTVVDIARLRLTQAKLAYLSACSTTDTNPQHTDEVTHLTAAFQLAGYRSVIGTIWPINDTAAAIITSHVYTHLTNTNASPPDPDQAAEALHQATRLHRNAHPNQPTQWAAHIHAGH